MTQSVLQVKNLSKNFNGFYAVNNISFEIKPGEIVGLLGPNGAGKTTTIQMLLGLMTPSSGEIFYFGLPFAKNREAVLQRLNYASGYSKLPWRLSVMENLKVFCRLYSVKNGKEKIKKIIKIFELEEFVHKQIIDLSAGQLARTLLAKAFLNDAELILLDEPTSALDPDVAIKIRNFILEERKNLRTTFLFTSHNMSEIEEICDRVIFLHKGKIIATDTPQALARKQKNSEVQLMVRIGFDTLQKIVQKHRYDLQIRQNISAISLPTAEIGNFLAEISRANIEYSEIEIVHPSLEDYFVTMSKEK